MTNESYWQRKQGQGDPVNNKVQRVYGFGVKKLVKCTQQASGKHLTPRHNIEKL